MKVYYWESLYFFNYSTSRYILIQDIEVQQYWYVGANLIASWVDEGGNLSLGYFQKSWTRVCDPLPKTLTLFMTKNLWFLLPFLCPGKKIGHSCPKHKLWRAFVDGLIDNNERVASSKKYTKFKIRMLKPYPIKTTMPEKLGLHISINIIAHIREYPQRTRLCAKDLAIKTVTGHNFICSFYLL